MDGIENSKDIEGNMGSMVSKEAGKKAAHELSPAAEMLLKR